MIIKLTVSGRNEAIFVNFDYVRTMRRDGAFTELVMSDDKYHKLAVLETPDEIYDMLYPPKPCSVSYCSGSEDKINDTPTSIFEVTPETTTAKKPTAKKTTVKSIEES